MHWSAALALVAMVTILVSTDAQTFQDRLTPPKLTNIYWRPNKIEYVLKNLTKNCIATGNPTPRYIWRRDGVELPSKERRMSLQDNWYDPVTGVLNLYKDINRNFDGVYQCEAKNNRGSALSDYLPIYEMKIGTFPEDKKLETLQKTEKTPLTLPCIGQPYSKPAARVFWKRMKKAESGEEIPAIEGSDVPKDRLLVDPQGSLHFIWLEMGDADWSYQCFAENVDLKITVGSHRTYKLDLSRVSQPMVPPKLRYNEDVEVMAGQNATLVCIFTYYRGDDGQLGANEKFTVEWQKDTYNLDGRKGFSIDRSSDPAGSFLVVQNAKISDGTEQVPDEGLYECIGRLGTYSEKGRVNLKIVAPPMFETYGQIKKEYLVPKGRNAVMNCSATSHNAVTLPPTWWKNGELLLGCPPKTFECRGEVLGKPECIAMDEVCDSFRNCADGSDESASICKGISCAEGKVACNGVCQDKGDPCDETFNCPKSKFRCQYGTECLEREQYCNGQQDCQDGSDFNRCSFSAGKTEGRLRFSGDRTSVTIDDVNMSDDMCLQCVVKNAYGYSFSSGCLTVIKGIVITYQPEPEYLIEPPGEEVYRLDLGVDAVADVLVQVRYEWYLENRGENKDESIRILPTQDYQLFFTLANKDRNLTIIIPTQREGGKQWENAYNTIVGDYSVRVFHADDIKIVPFSIIGKSIAPVPDTVKAASANLWIIALILGVLLLFIVVALVICYMYRNRGGTYPLDKKEHQAGHNPEQELKDSGFHDVGRVDDDYDDEKPRADEVSLSESVKPYESDDEDITLEYGDIDVGKFNEDGSFIGLYSDKKSKSSPGTKEATV